MKKLISVLAAFSFVFATVASAAELGLHQLFTENTEGATLTPTGGVLIEEGKLRDSGYYGISFMSSGAEEQPLDSYLREQLLNHTTTINVSAYKIPATEFADKFFTFIFCNSDLPIHAAYNNGTTFTHNGVQYMYAFNPLYVYSTKAECESKYKELDALTTSLAQYASKGKTDLEKSLFLFDKISLDYYYTPGSTFERINFTPYSFLDNGHGVCQGYAILYKLALNKLNIESYICSNLDEAVNHAWNYIKIDEKWYHADPTWSYLSDASDKVSRKYFLLSDDAMVSDTLHGAKDDWDAWHPNLSSINCISNDYTEGYLFRDFTDDPIYRDNSSLYFSTTINKSIELTIRNDSLKSPNAVMSVPDSSYKVYILTLRPVNDSSDIIIASYGENENYLRCSKLTAETLPANTLIPLEPYTPQNDVTKLKWMLVSSNTLSPISYYSQVAITK